MTPDDACETNTTLCPPAESLTAEVAESLTAEVANVSDVVRQRGWVYGHPADDFRRVSQIEQVLMECQDPELRHVLLMIAVKMARLVQTPEHRDSWIDIAGYVTTAAMVIDRRGQ